MQRRFVVIILGVVAAIAIAAGAVALASGDSDENVTGAQADRAVKAALEETGGGTANSVELDGEDGAKWEVEVTKTDGSTVDVRLDDNFDVVVVEPDTEAPDTDDPDDEE
jgi:peptidase YpeB-like protein